MSGMTRKVLHTVVLAVVILVAIRYVDFSVIRSVSIFDVIAVMLVTLIANTARFYTLKLAMLRRKIHLNVRQWLGLGVYSSLLNLILPLRAGLSIKAVYLKRKFNFRYADFLGTQSAINLLQVYVLIAAGGLCGLITNNVDNGVLVLLLVFVMLGVSTPFLFKQKTKAYESKILRILHDIYNSFLYLVKDVRFMVEILVNMLVILLFTGLALYFAFEGLGVKIGLPVAILIGTVASLISVVNVTPGNIGIQEVVVGFLGQAFGGDFDSGFVAMLLVRTMSVLGYFLLSPVGIGMGFRDKSNICRDSV